jgi:hypothetical protein
MYTLIDSRDFRRANIRKNQGDPQTFGGRHDTITVIMMIIIIISSSRSSRAAAAEQREQGHRRKRAQQENAALRFRPSPRSFSAQATCP